MVFLQTWRASIIPLVAVPVSLIGTFAVMLAMGFSLNTLSLFGLVLAIGIVVDDAIVVVENVERHIELGLPPLEATRRAMEEVSGPIIAIALVLCAVFVPTAFISGLTGQFYRQFALTIAISTVISAFNSLTLSPALASRLLKPHEAPRDVVQRAADRLFGWFFRRFNALLHARVGRVHARRRRVLRVAAVAVVVYVGLIGLTFVGFSRVPPGFVPTQDKEYLVAFAQLPDGATLDRTEAVIRKMSAIALEASGRASSVAFPGLSINGFVNAPNAGIAFVVLKPSEERTTPRAERPTRSCRRSTASSSARSRKRSSRSSRRRRCRGSGTVGGFKLYVEDRGGAGFEELYAQLQASLDEGADAAVAGRALLELPGERAADRRRRRSRAREELRRGADRRLRDAAGLSRLALRERLQPLRPHLSGQRAGRVGVSACSPSRSAGSRRATPTARWCRSARS